MIRNLSNCASLDRCRNNKAGIEKLNKFEGIAGQIKKCLYSQRINASLVCVLGGSTYKISTVISNVSGYYF